MWTFIVNKKNPSLWYFRLRDEINVLVLYIDLVFFPKEIHSKPNHLQKKMFVFCFVFLSNFNPHSPKSTQSSLEATTLPLNWGLSFNMKWYTIWLLYIYPLFLTNYSIGPCFLMPNSSNCLVKIYIPDPPPPTFHL